jgi:FAD/FMN-containing dehydrogenase
VPAACDPLQRPFEWYVLTELADQDANDRIQGMLADVLEAAMDAGEVLDGVTAVSKSEADALWQIREGIPEGQRHEGCSYKHDVSVPISKVDVFLERADHALMQAFPGIRPFSFGHLGDGNVHYNPMQPDGADPKEWVKNLPAANRIVHDIIMDLDGSISAEHGIGQLRLDELPRCKAAIEVEMMATLKKAFDPLNIMNPRKVVPPSFL